MYRSALDNLCSVNQDYETRHFGSIDVDGWANERGFNCFGDVRRKGTYIVHFILKRLIKSVLLITYLFPFSYSVLRNRRDRRTEQGGSRSARTLSPKLVS